MEEFNYNDQYNLYDHGGYLIKTLYIKQKFQTFKEEMSNYENFDLIHYKDVLLPKIKELVETQIVKESRPHINIKDSTFVPLSYSISEGASLSDEHLLALLLYTDFTDLSRDFSASHRGLNSYEPLKAIKERNRNYWFMSKRLRECVQLYGDYYGPKKNRGDLKGPFCM